ncbi:CRISPR-associated endonuclease Cas3'', partial [Candidatus Parcubacteria bacterium]
MRELISHPPDASRRPIRLYDHLSDTGHRAAALILRLKSNLNLAVRADDLAKAAFIAGCTHDFGKAKHQFQDYIHGGKGKDKDHAAISSVFTFIVASHVFGKRPQPTRLLPFVCAYAVNRHHGLLCNLEEAFEEASIEHQIAIAKNKIDERLWEFEFRYDSLGF